MLYTVYKSKEYSTGRMPTKANSVLQHLGLQAWCYCLFECLYLCSSTSFDDTKHIFCHITKHKERKHGSGKAI